MPPAANVGALRLCLLIAVYTCTSSHESSNDVDLAPKNKGVVGDDGREDPIASQLGIHEERCKEHLPRPLSGAVFVKGELASSIQ